MGIRLKVRAEHPCTHRGEVLDTIDCRCAGNLNVYACDIHGQCMIRKLKPGMKITTFCNVCDERKPLVYRL